MNGTGHVMGKQPIAAFVGCGDLRHGLRDFGVDFEQGFAAASPADSSSWLCAQR